MFRKLHTTGPNKIHRALAFLLAVLLMASMPIVATAEEVEYGLDVSGFSLNFDVDDDYYLVNPENFADCRITGFKGFTDISVSVEQYATYFPYASKEYVLGEPLELGYGRSKVTVTATLPDSTMRNYMIILTDPNGADNAYAKVFVNSSVALRSEPSTNGEVLAWLTKGLEVYYLGTEGDWAHIQYVKEIRNSSGVVIQRINYVGWIKDTADENYIRWNWEEVAMPAEYAAAVEALKAAHPNWTFTFVDTEKEYFSYMEDVALLRAETRAGADGYSSGTEAYNNRVEALYKEYLPQVATYLDPLYYLNEDRIFAFLDIDTYDPDLWTGTGIDAIWDNRYALQQNPNIISKTDAVNYFKNASQSLQMNPYYIACRAALESGYGGSQFARGAVAGYEGYYNFFGIQCYDSNPTRGAQYAKDRNWNTVERSIIEGANWVKDQYLDRGAVTPYFFRYSGFWNKAYMSDLKAPQSEATILKRAYTDANAKAHFIVPVYASHSFVDLDPAEWYYVETVAAIKAQLFNGVTATEFKPNNNMTRAEFVTALSRLCGVDVSSYETDKFVDVKKEDWHYRYVAWAAQTGVTEGVAADQFAPEKEITRQEMCKMMGTAIEKLLGHTLTVTASSSFKDQASIADWAKEWVEKCYNAGIFKGDDLGNFNPEANAIRCQAACVFYRCSEKYV